jgi:hypothetical protein
VSPAVSLCFRLLRLCSFVCFRILRFYRKSAAANDGLQQTKCALIPRVGDEGQKSSGGNKHWLPTVWWRCQEVRTSREKIRSEGGGFRSEPVWCGGQDTRECKREREFGTKWSLTQESARERVPLTKLEQPITLDDHTAWYLYPQARAPAILAYYKYGPSTYGQCEHGH